MKWRAIGVRTDKLITTNRADNAACAIKTRHECFVSSNASIRIDNYCESVTDLLEIEFDSRAVDEAAFLFPRGSTLCHQYIEKYLMSPFFGPRFWILLRLRCGRRINTQRLTRLFFVR